MPLTVGAVVVALTLVVHAMALTATVSFFRHERRAGRTGVTFQADFIIVWLVVAFAFVAHMVEIFLWAELFVILREFQDFGTACYHSAVNYTTLGYGDLLLTPSWRMLGPIEAADGALMFGVSTAMIFAVIQRLLLTRFRDLRDEA